VKRRLLNLLTCLSLLICVVVVALWVRSFWVDDILDYDGITWSGAVRARPGMVLAGFEAYDTPQRWSEGLKWIRARPFELGTLPDVWGFYLRRGDRFALGLPDWLLVVLFGIAPACWLIRRKRRRVICERNEACAPPVATTSAPRPSAVRSAE